MKCPYCGSDDIKVVDSRPAEENNSIRRRPVNAESVANEIESEIQNSLKREVTSSEIGDMAMEKLRELDAVAYVRFASVHREFKDVETFMKELQTLKSEEKD